MLNFQKSFLFLCLTLFFTNILLYEHSSLRTFLLTNDSTPLYNESDEENEGQTFELYGDD